MEHSERAHAPLGPSSAERWLTCTASPTFIATLGRTDDSGSVWAGEGTNAHELAEIEARWYFGQIDEATYKRRLKAWRKKTAAAEWDADETAEHVATYVSLLADLHAELLDDGLVGVHLEQRLRTSLPDVWGTGDAVLVSPTRVVVVDFKYGRGVAVNAQNNPQLRLYGFGALEAFDGIVGDFETVVTVVCQPRVGSVTREDLPTSDLRAWVDTVVRPAIAEIDAGGVFRPSLEACRWCPASGICRAQKDFILALDFEAPPDALDEEELAELVGLLPMVSDWAKAVEAEALQAMYRDKKTLPGLKVVMSGGKRAITNDEEAIEALVAAGYDREAVSRTTAQTLGALEKVVGKNKLPEVLGSLLRKGEGRPSIAPVDDPREAVTSMTAAIEDFSPHDGS